MNILVDVGHPAHVHLFRNSIKILEAKGHNIYITTKHINSVIELLNIYNIDFIDFGKKKNSILGKGLFQIKYNYKMIKIARKNKIDIGFGSSITLAQITPFVKMKALLFDDDDDDVEPLVVKYAHPFCNAILSPESLKGKRIKKDTIYYAGFHELAYLHPKLFKPDKTVLSDIGLKEAEPFFIMRFNLFKAHHDVGVCGLSTSQKQKLVKILEPHGKVYITTEGEIEPELKKYQLSVSPEKVHSLMYYASMFLGDSQTMTSEAAVLGTPAIRMNSLVGRIAYLEEEEHKYYLTYGFKPNQFEEMTIKINELLDTPNLKQVWEARRQKLFSEKINVTAFMVWFIENWPESFKIMKEKPDYQYNFK